jgi:hypothetical protein
LGLFAKLDPRALNLTATSDLKVIFIILIIIPIVIFIILIIILNLSDLSLIGSSCNAIPKSFGCEFDYKAVLWKCNNYIKKLILKNEIKQKRLIKKKKIKQITILMNSVLGGGV